MIARALSADRASRPTAKELYSYLYRVIAPRVTAPEIIQATLLTPVLLRGLDARVEWQISGAAHVTILAGTNFTTRWIWPRTPMAMPSDLTRLGLSAWRQVIGSGP